MKKIVIINDDITKNTKLSDLLFGILCGNVLYIISFDKI